MIESVDGKADLPSAVRLRALTHPLRWKLLDAVEVEGTATATRCAQLTGESVASCSYHLSILGKYGYLEQIPGPGKEKPWRLANFDQRISLNGPGIEDRMAAEEASEAFIDHEYERMKASLRRVDSEPPEWRGASVAGGSTMWVTADELKQIKEEMLAIVLRHSDRSKKPKRRPEGARASRVFFYTAVAPEQ